MKKTFKQVMSAVRRSAKKFGISVVFNDRRGNDIPICSCGYDPAKDLKAAKKIMEQHNG